MKNFSHTEPEFDMRELNEAESLDLAIESLLQNKRLTNKVPKAFYTAVRLKTDSDPPYLRREFDITLEKKLVKLFEKEKEVPFWKTLFAPSFASASVFAVLALVLVFNPLSKPETIPQLAEVQLFEPLSRAEILLGQLPENAQTQNGVLIRDLRADIHKINQQFAKADTTLNPELDKFPHVELRNNALQVIHLEVALLDKFENSPAKEEKVLAFADKVYTWPTTNEGVSFEVHAKSVNSYMTHKAKWEQESYELAVKIMKEVQAQTTK